MHKRSFIRGFVVGVVVKMLCTIAFTLVLAAILKSGAWAEEGSLMHDGRFPVFSRIWFTAQCLVLFGALLAGSASSHWSEYRSWAAPVALALVWLLWSATRVDPGQPLSAVVVKVSISSVGILLGAVLYRRWRGTSDA